MKRKAPNPPAPSPCQIKRRDECNLWNAMRTFTEAAGALTAEIDAYSECRPGGLPEITRAHHSWRECLEAIEAEVWFRDLVRNFEEAGMGAHLGRCFTFFRLPRGHIRVIILTRQAHVNNLTLAIADHLSPGLKLLPFDRWVHQGVLIQQLIPARLPKMEFPHAWKSFWKIVALHMNGTLVASGTEELCGPNILNVPSFFFITTCDRLNSVDFNWDTLAR